ncbi:hypothetical protein [Azospirillum oryzae]|uniref:hypothetical protein n=1 Tax=Azospirillum oryzae TaxID=286727 RepID=UPI001FE6735C|nr:hypothetical protein [Azospirillum oryzae]GLR82999.1 hypothetical protein GCM10007856_57070 [Azospirillum oryzae]
MSTAFTRTTTRTVTFTRPFELSGMDGVQPAGSYVVETDEELIDSLSFPVYRRTATWIHLPHVDGRSNGGSGMAQTALIDPDELDRILASAETPETEPPYGSQGHGSQGT